MTSKELKRLTRTDLLEMLIQQSQRVEDLELKLKSAEEELKKREIHIAEAGSIAEASLRVNGVFETAQAAAEVYLENISVLLLKQEQLQKQAETEFEQVMLQKISQTDAYCYAAENETKKRCDEMRDKAAVDIRRYWDEIVRRLELLYSEYPGLKERVADLSEP